MAVGTAAALIGSAALGVGGSIYAGRRQADAARQAARSGEAWQMYALDRQLEVAAPTMRIGYGAQKQLAELYGINSSARLPWEERRPETRYGGPNGAIIDGRTGRVIGERPRRANEPGGRPLGAGNRPGRGPVGATAAGPPSFTPASADPRLKNFFTSPGYGFRIEEGTKALDRSAAARGGLFSGAQGKAVTRFGQNIASDEYGRWLAGLQSLAGQGISANTGYGNAVGQTGSDLARIYGNSAYARGSAYAGATAGALDAIGGGISDWIYARERGLI